MSEKTNILHRIKHWFGWYSGRVVSGMDVDLIWVGFQCSYCGKIEGVHDATKIIDNDLKS